MGQSIINWDVKWFLKINHTWSNSFFDMVLPMMRDAKTWIPLYVFLVVFFIYKYKKCGFLYIGGVLLSFALADILSASIIKPLVQRLRPCRTVEIAQEILVRVSCGSGFSFPSSHACNHFAMAVFLGVILGEKYFWVWFLGIFWAFLISYSQVYVGVHFPLDVIGGALIGTVIGFVVGRLIQNIALKLN